MKRLLICALSTSAALIAPINTAPALAKDCPPLNVAEITVQDPDRNIKLRTDPQKEGLQVPGAEGADVTVQPGKPLAVIKDTRPQFNQSDKSCYYAVAFKDGEKHGNVIPGILSHKPYWISQKGIKDYATLVNGAKPRSLPTPSPPPGKPLAANRNFPLFQILAWSIIPVLIAGILIWAFLQREKLFAQFQPKFNRGSNNQTRSRGSRQGNTQETAQREYPPNLNFIPDPELPDSLTRLISATTNVQYEVDRNTRHVKNVEALLSIQNQLLQQDNQLLAKIVELLEGERRSPLSTLQPMRQSMPLNRAENEQDSLLLGDLFEDSGSTLQVSKTSIPEQTQIFDPFFGVVIDHFNNANQLWFESRIQDGIFRKAQITKSSIADMTQKTTLVELSTNGTLLIYHAAEKLCLIPDPTQPKWKRTVTSSLFNGEIGNLVRPVELTIENKNLWRVIKKGEFQP